MGVRYLIVVRHAKAERLAAGGRDVDRSLSARGRRQCARLRDWATDDHGLAPYGPATALVSASVRTRETFLLGFANTALVTTHSESSVIYNGERDVSADVVMSELAAHDVGGASLLLVGHNPTLSELIATLVAPTPSWLRDGYPTASVCVVALPGPGPFTAGRYEMVARFVVDER